MKTFVVLVIAALCAAIGDIFLSHGMRSSGPASGDSPWRILDHLLVVVRNYHVSFGVFFMGCFFYLYLASLSWADLSFAKPITALSFAFSAVFAAVILREDVSWHRWVGAALVVLGVFLVSFDKKQRTDLGIQPGQVESVADP